jgi:CubicO group peptidase (beta-lactamase class C family)
MQYASRIKVLIINNVKGLQINGVTMLKFSLMCLIFLISSANTQTVSTSSELVNKCEDLISRKMKSDNIIGVSAAIIVDDSIIWKKGFGYADKENRVPMTINTVVNTASVTKTFTALAIMQLQEKGLIDINQPLKKYLPRFNPKCTGAYLERLTIRSVITHSSGIQTDILKNTDAGSGKYTDVLGFINDTYLLYPPGMVESYSNSGYNILGHLIKEVSGQDYTEYIHENIFAPLGMSHSGFLNDSLINRTKIYSGGESIKEYGFSDIASGGIYTDITDFTKYARGLMDAYNGMNSALIQTPSIREMFTFQHDQVLIESNKKGLGWFMFRNDSAFALTHAGDAAWGHAEICLVPERKAAVMILINSAEGESLRRDISSSFIKNFGMTIPDIIPPRVIKNVQKEIQPVNLTEDILKAHAGDYSPGFSIITISVEDGNLIMDRDNRHFLLKALSENEFVPCEKIGQDSLVEKNDERYCFMDSDNFHMLFHEAGSNETRLGYKLNKFNTSSLNKKLGRYEHFGYQLLVGDTKFKGAELSLAGQRVMVLKLIADDGAYTFPLNVISDEYAVTSGLGTGFAYTVKFMEDKKHFIIDFGGITFKKIK